jgi:leucyl-tRNA---protein transferase
MPGTDFELINEELHSSLVSPEQLDRLLAMGWRHFGTHFFRYNFGFPGSGEQYHRRIMPLRIRLADFRLSKNQRRVLKRNLDTVTVIRPIDVTPEAERLYDAHSVRFPPGQPPSVYTFLSYDPANVPTEGREVAVYLDGRLISISYVSIGVEQISSVFAMFDPDMPRRSLGILTILKELEHAREEGKTYYYHGYAYDGPSFYDYKKRFSGLEQYDWATSEWSDYDKEKDVIDLQ